jgi:hypothetical protein
MGHCFVAAHYGCPADQLDIYATLSGSGFVLPEGKQCLTHVRSIHDRSGDALPGWEKQSFAIALGGEMIERIDRGQSLDEIMAYDQANVAALFAGSLHQGDYVQANYKLSRVPGDLVIVVHECMLEVFNALQRALLDIRDQANLIESWVSEAWSLEAESFARSLVPTPTNHWIALSVVKGRSGLHLRLATDFPNA